MGGQKTPPRSGEMEGGGYRRKMRGCGVQNGVRSDFQHKLLDTESIFREPERERQKSLYVDFHSATVTEPEKLVSKNRVLKTLEVALHLFDGMEDMGLASTYWTDTKKTKRRAKVFVQSLKEIFKGSSRSAG